MKKINGLEALQRLLKGETIYFDNLKDMGLRMISDKLYTIYPKKGNSENYSGVLVNEILSSTFYIEDAK